MTSTLDTITVDHSLSEQVELLIIAASEQQEELIMLRDRIREQDEHIATLTDEIESLQDEVRAD